MLKMLREAGLYSVIVGVESGNERIRKEVLNRHMSNAQIENIFRWADELGIETWDFNMLGLPDETEENVRETIELNRRIRPDHVQISIFYPFPGTPLHERCEKDNLIPQEHTTSVFHNRATLELPNLSREKINHLFDEFRALGYLLEAQKRPSGYYDFTAHFDEASIQSGGEKFVALWLVRIGGEDRLSLLLHPPSSATYNLTVQPGSALRFGMAFSPDVWDKPGKGCTFEVLCKTRFRGTRTIFSEYVDPKHIPEQRGWLDREVNLSELGGKKVELTLRTSTPAGENEYCVAFFSRPHLVEIF
jgi:hypothetical protein